MVVSLVLGQGRLQVPLAEDEHPVGDLGRILPELIRLLRVRIKRYAATSGGAA